MALQLFYFLTLAGIICCQEVIKMRVKEDEDVILPCSLDSTNIRTQTFAWRKDDQKNVFQFSAGSHYNNGRGGQDLQFKGRVFHFEDQLQSGNASIEIKKTTKTDSGYYSCSFPFHQPTIRSIIELIVVIKVKEDEDVILPCSLDSTNIKTDVFDWKKDDQKNVFLYSSGSHSNNGRGGQDPQFKGRVFHFEDQLQSGNASIEIRKSKVTDSGSYSCIFPFHQPRIRSIIELLVGSSPKPYVTNLDETFDRALLECEVQGAFPKPKVQWLDSENKIVPAEEPQETESEGKYNIILKATVTKSDVYRCVSTQEEIHHQTDRKIEVSLLEFSYELLVAVAISDAVLLLIYGILYVLKSRSSVKRFKQLYYGLLAVALVSGATVFIFLVFFLKETHTRINSSTEYPYGLLIAVSVFSPVLLLIYGILLVPNIRIFTIRRHKLYYGLLVAAAVSGVIVSILLVFFLKETCTRINCNTVSESVIGLTVVVVLGVLLVLGDIFRQIFTIVKNRLQQNDKDPDFEEYKPWIFFTDELKDMRVTNNAFTQTSRAELEAERAELKAERRAYFEENKPSETIVPAKHEGDTTDKNKSGNHEEMELMNKSDGGSKAGTIFFNEHED